MMLSNAKDPANIMDAVERSKFDVDTILGIRRGDAIEEYCDVFDKEFIVLEKGKGRNATISRDTRITDEADGLIVVVRDSTGSLVVTPIEGAVAASKRSLMKRMRAHCKPIFVVTTGIVNVRRMNY